MYKLNFLFVKHKNNHFSSISSLRYFLRILKIQIIPRYLLLEKVKMDYERISENLNQILQSYLYKNFIEIKLISIFLL